MFETAAAQSHAEWLESETAEERFQTAVHNFAAEKFFASLGK